MVKIKKTLSRRFRSGGRRRASTARRFRAEDCDRFWMPGCMRRAATTCSRGVLWWCSRRSRRSGCAAASYNQAKVEEASAVIVACGDADGWRKDLELMLEQGLEGGMPESYAEQARSSVPKYLSSLTATQMKGWLNKKVMLAFTHMMLMAEVMGYDTAPMEGFEQEKVHEMLRLPMSYWVVALLAIGHLKGPDKFDGGRFEWRIRCSAKSSASR